MLKTLNAGWAAVSPSERVIRKIKIFIKEGWQQCRPSFYQGGWVGFVLLALISSCDKPDSGKVQIYEGPIQEAENIIMQYSEKESVTTKIIAKKVSEYQNGDHQFPEGVFIEFYAEDGSVSSTLSANTAFYYKAEHKWKGQGNVVVRNLKKEEQLNTEELYWFPNTKKIHTDKFVTIRTGKEIIYGTGLDAKQDMSEYQILKPEGDFSIDEENP